MKKLLFWVILISSMSVLPAQQLQLSDDIQVRGIDGTEWKMPWTGGIDNPKISNIDFNFDGNMDIVVMDEGSIFQRLVFIPLMNMGNGNFRYAPEYESGFENCECRQEGTFVDYNKDGIADLFCNTGGGNRFRVYQGFQACEDSISFFLSDTILLAENPSNGNQELVSMNKGDVSAIGDVDFDGDIDIITTQVGFNRLTLYQNVSMEVYGNCDTLSFEKITTCWGHFSEFLSNDSLFLADTTSFACQIQGRFGPGNTRHAGTTLMLLDHNADSLMDILIGDAGTNRSNLAISSGPLDDPIMTDAIYAYPGNADSIYVWNYVANYYVDLNQDGIRDIASAPKNSDPTLIENVKGLSWLENTGADNLPIWQARGRTFMVDDHIDAGSNSSPAFFDYNADGKMDIMVGNFVANYKVGDTIRGTSELHVYENIGTTSQPAFQLRTKDYMSFSQNFPFIIRAVPTFGDLDGDGDVDMLIGAANGRIYRFNNQAGPGNTAAFTLDANQFLYDEDFVPVFNGSSANPVLEDLDNDGDLDLFFGNFLGRITYYENVGSASAFTLRKKQEKFGGLQLFEQIPRDTFTVVRPAFFDHDGNGSKDLIVGGAGGYLEVYKDAALGLVQDLGNPDTVLNRYLRGSLSPTVTDLDGSGQPTYVVGNENGGLNLLKFEALASFCGTIIDTTGTGGGTDTTTTSVPLFDLNQQVNMYPNPAEDLLRIDFEGEEWMGVEKQIRLFNPVGQIVWSEKTFQVNQQINLNGLSSGIYFVEIQAKGQRALEKLVIR